MPVTHSVSMSSITWRVRHAELLGDRLHGHALVAVQVGDHPEHPQEPVARALSHRYATPSVEGRGGAQQVQHRLPQARRGEHDDRVAVADQLLRELPLGAERHVHQVARAARSGSADQSGSSGGARDRAGARGARALRQDREGRDALRPARPGLQRVRQLVGGRAP